MATFGLCALSSHARGANVALRATPEGIEQLQSALPALASRISVPTIDIPVGECNSGEAPHLELVNAMADLDWRDVDLSLEGDELGFDGTVDLQVSSELDVVNVGCFLTMQCNASITAKNVRMAGRISVVVGADGLLEFRPTDPVVDLSELSDLNVDVDGCSIGELASTIIDAMDDWIVEFLGEGLGDLASSGLTNLFARAPMTIPEVLLRGDFSLESVFEQASIDERKGLAFVAHATVVGVSPVAAPEVPDAEPTEEPFDSGSPSGAFELAAADTIVSAALRQAWWDGLFDKLLSQAAPVFELSTDEMSARLGVPAGTEIAMSITVGGQPSVRFGREQMNQASITLPNLTVAFEVRSPGARTGHLEVTTSADVVAGFRVAADGALVLVVEDLGIRRLSVSAGEIELFPDLARLEQLIRDVVLPRVQEGLESVPLAPALAPMDGVYVWIREINASGGWLRTSFNLFSRDPDDITPPQTSLEDRQVVRAGLVTLRASGTDDSTPVPLLRYNAWLDGAPIKDRPVLNPSLRFKATDGEHVLEVAAIDLNDNVDPEPVRVVLIVDGTAPILQVKSHPSPIVASGVVSASWAAADERHVVSTRWEIYALGAGGGPGGIVASGTAAATGSMRNGDLPHGKLYVLRIIAEDEAGNLTSEEFGFGFEQGCSAGGFSSSPSSVLLLIAMAAFARRKRRQRA